MNTNLVASGHITKEKDSLLVNVHHSKMPVLNKLHNNPVSAGLSFNDVFQSLL